MAWLKHYGTKRRSGRYPWGSGNNSEQRNTSFLGYVNKLRDQGLSDVEIANGMEMSTTEFRTRNSIAKADLRKNLSTQAQKLKDKGLSNVAIGERMKLNESSVRALLNPVLQQRADIAISVSNMLRDTIEKKGVIDIGSGVENHIGISATKLRVAVGLLKDEGYNTYWVDVPQLGTGKTTTMKVLAPPGMSFPEVIKNQSNIKTITDYSEDGGRSLFGLETPKSINSKRIQIRYAEEGGKDKDGVIELRRGVDDVSLGNAKYAQVRIAVDGTHYLKGMAIYTDKLPPGVDIIYNTNKKQGTDKLKVFKAMADDPDNPFGSVVRQKHYLDKNGKKELSALNIVNEEGKWDEWSRDISSQILSKQSPALAKRQLDLAKNLRLEEFDEISNLTNPVVKKRLLETFAEETDSAAVHLAAAALPRQSSKVILPIPSMKENEVYAPTYKDGESVVLIRHPHGGIFEIPELRVNNKNPDANRVMKNAKDAIGIHPKVAEKLSGADFDGDTVIVIPNRDKHIQTAPTLKALKDFDTKELYTLPDSAPQMKPRTKQLEMGKVSNLITDMTIKGATANEIARAVKHSMVVIDAEKHHLDYKRSEIDNNISDLKLKYQGRKDAGAATLISRAGSEIRIDDRKEGKSFVNPKTGNLRRVYVDPKTGKKLYENTGETYIKYPVLKDKITGKPIVDPKTGKKVYVLDKGKIVKKQILTTKMAYEEDAFKLSSGTKIESIYAEHANSLKVLANKARKLALETPDLVYSPTAKQTYAKEVAKLKADLNLAYRNRPLERQAQLLANKTVTAKKQANPDMEPDTLKKIKGQALTEARLRTGAKKPKIEISDRQWEAIQLGAISNNALKEILKNTDLDSLKTRALPRTKYLMTPAKIARAKIMQDRGYTAAEISSALGVSVSTLYDAVK